MKGSTAEIKTLVFDAYGTLYDVSSVAELCEGLFPGHGAGITATWRQKQLEYSWLSSLMRRYRNFWEITRAGLRFACAEQGQVLASDQEEALMDAYLRLAHYPEVPGALQDLSSRRPLAILSNGSPDMLNGVTRHNKFDGFFKAVLSVDELQVFKPAPAVYQLAVARLGVPASQVGFVSTNAWDAAGAKSFGFTVFWLNRFQRPTEQLELPPDHTISLLTDLKQLIDGD